MINLIKSEIKKVFKKRSFLIVTIIFIFYAIMTNVIYKNLNSLDSTTKYDIPSLQEENSHLDLGKEEDLTTFISNLTRIELENLKKDYNSGTQKYLIDKYLYNPLYSLISSRYQETKESDIAALTEKYNTTLELIKNSNWEYFIKENITSLETKLSKTTENKEQTRIKAFIDIENYRLKNNIPCDTTNYLNNALDAIKTNLTEYLNLQAKENLTKTETERLSYLKEDMLRNKYILMHKKDLNNMENLKSVLANFAEEFGLFILIYVVLIFGPIVSEEYSKGTIKYLLIKPYKRSTILLAKFLAGLILIPFVIILMLALEVLIGGLILGFNSLNIPILIYDSAKNILISYSIFKYVLIVLLSIIPMYLMLGIICFSLSTITTSTSAAITITFLFYLIANVISNLVLVYKTSIFKYFISLHWDFNYLITKTPNPYHFSYQTSIFVLLIYTIVILSFTFIYFNKKDVKNI